MKISFEISKKTTKWVLIVIVVVAVAVSLVFLVRWRIESTTAKAYFERGQDSYKKQDFKRAVSELEQAIEKDSDNPKSHFLLALSYEAQGKLDKAIKEYERAVELSPKDKIAHYNLAIAYKTKGKLAEAISELEEALRLDYKFVGARVVLADLYFRNNQTEQAIRQYQILIKMNPYGLDLASVHVSLGRIYLSQGKKAEAEAEFKAALEEDPNNKEAKELLEGK